MLSGVVFLYSRIYTWDVEIFLGKMMKKFIFSMLTITFLLGCQAWDDYFYKHSFAEFNKSEIISTDKFTDMKYILNQSVAKFKAHNGIFLLMDMKDATLISSYATNGHPTAALPYESGSVWDTITVAMGLESGMIRPNDQLDTEHPLKVDNHTITDYTIPNKTLTPEEVLIHSSNVGTAQIALKTGGVYQYDFIKSLGLLDEISLEDNIVSQSLYPNRYIWTHSDSRISSISFGFGISVSPLHLLTAYAALLNGGTYYAPTFEKDLEKQGRRVISQETSDYLKQALRQVVLKGAARQANLEEIVILGKTGTAQKIRRNKYESNVQTTFISTFPYDGHEYILLVMLDSPLGLKETFGYKTAGWNSVPTARELIKTIIR